MNDQLALAKKVLAVRMERLEYSDLMASNELRVFQASRIHDAERLVQELETKQDTESD